MGVRSGRCRVREIVVVLPKWESRSQLFESFPRTFPSSTRAFGRGKRTSPGVASSIRRASGTNGASARPRGAGYCSREGRKRSAERLKQPRQGVDFTRKQVAHPSREPMRRVGANRDTAPRRPPRTGGLSPARGPAPSGHRVKGFLREPVGVGSSPEWALAEGDNSQTNGTKWVGPPKIGLR